MKKRYVLKKWVKVTIWSVCILAYLSLFYLIFRITPEQRNAIDYCTSQGNSYENCKRGVLGY